MMQHASKKRRVLATKPKSAVTFKVGDRVMVKEWLMVGESWNALKIYRSGTVHRILLNHQVTKYDGYGGCKSVRSPRIAVVFDERKTTFNPDGTWETKWVPKNTYVRLPMHQVKPMPKPKAQCKRKRDD